MSGNKAVCLKTDQVTSNGEKYPSETCWPKMRWSEDEYKEMPAKYYRETSWDTLA
jgi:hypothetical protein